MRFYFVRRPDFRHRADIGKLRNALNEDDIRGLDVAMREPISMEKVQGLSQRDSAWMHSPTGKRRLGAITQEPKGDSSHHARDGFEG